VPEYWRPPSLFDLALKNGFDIESLLFAFGQPKGLDKLKEEFYTI
jgi:hypothetical protein